MGLKHRLKSLETRARMPKRDSEREKAVLREVLSRMTDSELRLYEAAVERCIDAAGVFAEEDSTLLERDDALSKEVRVALAGPA